ncbi:MAG TPA: glycosyltransferase [Spirochaetota bacterium]|nr:glycosyltransferase [Spirochaetota bacterium]
MPRKPESVPKAPFIRRIAILLNARLPSHHTDTQQVMKNAAALTANGLRVTVFVPQRGRYLFRRGSTFRRVIHEYYNIPEELDVRGVRALPAGRFRPEKLTHALLVPFLVLFRRIPILYTREPLAALLGLLLGRRVIFETYRCLGDEYPRLIRFMGRFARGRRFLGVITHSRFAAASFERAGFPADRLAPFHNGYAPTDMEPVLDRTAARRATGLPPKKFLLVYTGNMQANKGVEALLDLAAACPGETFVLVGGTPADLERLGKIARERHLKNVIFTGMKPVGDVPKYLYAADVLLVPPTSAPLLLYGRTVLPFKTFLYMAAGRPILGPDLPDLREVLTPRSAVLVTPDDTRAAAKALEKLAGDPALCKKIGSASAKAAAGLTWDERGKRIAGWIAERYHASLTRSARK